MDDWKRAVPASVILVFNFLNINIEEKCKKLNLFGCYTELLEFRKPWKKIHRTASNRSASRIELSLDRCESSRPDPDGLGRGVCCVWVWCNASPAPSLQKNFRTDENLFFRSVTGLASVGIGSGTLHWVCGRCAVTHFLASLQRRLRWYVGRHFSGNMQYFRE